MIRYLLVVDMYIISVSGVYSSYFYLERVLQWRIVYSNTSDPRSKTPLDCLNT